MNAQDQILTMLKIQYNVKAGYSICQRGMACLANLYHTRCGLFNCPLFATIQLPDVEQGLSRLSRDQECVTQNGCGIGRTDTTLKQEVFVVKTFTFLVTSLGQYL